LDEADNAIDTWISKGQTEISMEWIEDVEALVVTLMESFFPQAGRLHRVSGRIRAAQEQLRATKWHNGN
jgi:hypothetical protein